MLPPAPPPRAPPDGAPGLSAAAGPAAGPPGAPADTPAATAGPLDTSSGCGWSDPGEPTLPAPDGVDAGSGAAPPARYTVGALLGRGGMGAVYAARDTTLGRDVALKEVQAELAGNPGAHALLAREAAVTGRLDHPGIVSVHDSGRLPDGRPFYTMRLVRGRTLGRAAAEATTPAARRQLVRHVLAAADAVAAAHDAGVVHRDLKPANILIGSHGETQVVDWGLATPTPAAAERWADLPAGPVRGTVGTPPYMAPEQARGEAPDPRHDVWSLGTTLARVVGGAARELPPELAAIVARATAPAPADRYPDAAAFADDLLRWFEGRRVAAYAYTPGDLLRRTLVAYRLPLGVGAVGLVALALAVAGGWWQTTRSLDRALAAEAGARASLADLRLEQAVAATRAGARETAERLALAVLREREDPLARGIFAAFGRSERPALVREEAGPACAWSLLPLEPDARWVLCGTADAVARWEAGRVVWTAPIAAVGGEMRADRVILWDAAETVVALDPRTGAEAGRWPWASSEWMPQVPPRSSWAGDGPFAPGANPPAGCFRTLRVATVSPGGRLAVVCADGTLLLGTRADPVQVRVATDVLGDHVAMSVAWTPDERLVVGTLRGRVYVFAGDTGALVAMGETGLGALGALRVSPDGRHVALGGTLGGVGLWRIDTAALVGEVPAARPRAFAFTDEGLRVHTPAHGGGVRTWRVPGGAPSLIRGTGGLADVTASPSGAYAALAGGDGSVVEVDLRDGRTRRAVLGEGVVKAVAFGAGEGGGIGGVEGGPTEPWPRLIAAGMVAPFLAEGGGAGWAPGGWAPVTRARPLRRVAWLADRSIVGIDLDAGLFRWTDPAAAPAILAADRRFADLERDGDALVVVDAFGRVERLDGDRFTPLVTVPEARAVALRSVAAGAAGPARGVAAGAAGAAAELLAVATEDTVQLHRAGAVRRLAVPGASLLDVALSPDGARVAAASLDGNVRVWDVATGTLLGLLPGHAERVVSVEFLPGGDLVSASWDKTARAWSLAALDRDVDTLAAEVAAAWGAEPE